MERPLQQFGGDYATTALRRSSWLEASLHAQMVINGTTELLGSSREKSRMAIQAAITKRPQSSIN